MSVLYPCLYLYCSPSSYLELNSESEKQSKLYLALSLSIFASHCLLIFDWLGYWSINYWASLSSRVSGNLESGGTLLGASESLFEVVFSVVVGSGNCHPNLLPFPDFCRRDNLVPIHICLFLGWWLIVLPS